MFSYTCPIQLTHKTKLISSILKSFTDKLLEFNKLPVVVSKETLVNRADVACTVVAATVVSNAVVGMLVVAGMLVTAGTLVVVSMPVVGGMPVVVVVVIAGMTVVRLIVVAAGGMTTI